MKDLVELFEDQDREYRSDWRDDNEARCSYCRHYFPETELEELGEQVVNGTVVHNAVSCVSCLPEGVD